MIRWAEQADLQAVVSLWTRCFPGDEAFREWFFANIYRSDVTLVDEEDGTLCAMVQMLPYQKRFTAGISAPVKRRSVPAGFCVSSAHVTMRSDT